MPPALKRAAGLAGAVLCVLALVLLARRGFALGATLGDRLAGIGAAAFLEALALYCAGAVALAFAWAALVRAVARDAARRRPLVIAHLRSQVAKYLPGNVFHFAFRHAAARAQGVSHAALASALAFESALLVAAAALLASGVAADPRLAQAVPWAREFVRFAPPLAAVGVVALAIGLRRFDARRPLRQVLARCAQALAFDLAFFLLAALALRLLAANPAALPFATWCGWLALAWGIGYVVPGAPAGLGLREVVLTLGLKPALGEADALAIALAYRLVTTVADAVLAGLGFLLRPGAKPTRESTSA